MRAHQNTWGRVSQAWKRVQKGNNDISYFQFKRLIGINASGYADDCWQFVCTCTVIFPPKWWSRLSWHHKTTSQESLMHKKGGKYKRGSSVELEEFGCCCIVIWVFIHTLYGLLLSHRPSTSAVLVPLMQEALSRCTVLLVLSISECPDLFGGLWVIMTLFIWRWPRWTTTFSPGTWYQAKHGSQPIGSELNGWDKSLAWCESTC